MTILDCLLFFKTFSLFTRDAKYYVYNLIDPQNPRIPTWIISHKINMICDPPNTGNAYINTHTCYVYIYIYMYLLSNTEILYINQMHLAAAGWLTFCNHSTKRRVSLFSRSQRQNERSQNTDKEEPVAICFYYKNRFWMVKKQHTYSINQC